MTVRELRELLARYPDDLPVMVDGYEGGLHDLTAAHIYLAPVVHNQPHDAWSGPHGVFEAWMLDDDTCPGPDGTALLLSRLTTDERCEPHAG